MKGIDEKISAIIDHFQLNNFSFSKRVGVTSTTVDSIVNGRLQKDGSRKKTKPGYDVLKAIIETFNINPDYLFGKSTVMLRSAAENYPTYSGIPKVISVNDNGEENVVFVPVQARAGYLNGYGDPEYIESLPSFHMPYLANNSYRCFEVKGNSMLNTFVDGDLVFGIYVEQLNDIKDGDAYIVVSKSEGVVLKRVFNKLNDNHTLVLKSDNQNGNHPSYAINVEDLEELWQVKMYASKQIPEPLDINDRLFNIEQKIVDLEAILQFKK